MQIRLLGPVQIAVGDQVVQVGPPQRCLVLAALAVDAGRQVTMETLMQRVWGEHLPEKPQRAVQTHIANIRGLLRRAGTPGQAAVPLQRRQGGYVLDVDREQVDMYRFRRLTNAAAKPGQTPAERVARLREALGLWRGEPLAGLAGDWVEGTRTAWQTQYRNAVLGWAYAEIQADNPTAVIGSLTDLINQEPADEAPDEALVAMLMRALYAAGRRSDALDFFQTAKRRLTAGTGPGDELAAVHRAVVDRHAELPAPPGALPPATAVPAQLPTDVDGFAGRGAEISELDRLLARVGRRTTAVVISAIAGTAGVGKTALAVHWAHQAARHFPDGQLYVNLRGFDPAGTVMTPAEAVRRILDALGVDPQRIPTDPDEQVTLYRSLLAAKKMLLVLDNARDPHQVRPLLPGAAGCLVLVTSRHRLAGLVATVGAHPIPLDLLTFDEAYHLLALRLGYPRVTAEPDPVDDIITRCARLPLALAIVAANAATQPRRPLATIAAELRDAHDRLDVLTTGDDTTTDLRAVFSWSYHALTEHAARLFRLLGLHPGPDISAPAAASIAGLPTKQVRQLLKYLTGAHLIEERTPGRYSFHDLLRVYAADLAHTTDSDADRHAAVHRMLDHYLHTAHTAARLLAPARDSITVAAPRPGAAPEHLVDHHQAVVWFSAEHSTLLAAINQAASAGLDAHTWQLAWTLSDFLNRRGHWHDLATTQRAAVAAARRMADSPAQAFACLLVAGAYLRLGHFDDAHIQLRHALDLSTQAGDSIGQARTHIDLAGVWIRKGRHAEALHHARQALGLFRAAGHRTGEARALNSVGWSHAQRGDHRQALGFCQEALRLHQQLGDLAGQAHTRDSLGYAHHHLGHHTRAITCYQQALDLFRDLGDRYNEADILAHLGDNHRITGDVQAARDSYQQAITILDDLGNPDVETVRAKLQQLDQPPPPDDPASDDQTGDDTEPT